MDKGQAARLDLPSTTYSRSHLLRRFFHTTVTPLLCFPISVATDGSMCKTRCRSYPKTATTKYTFMRVKVRVKRLARL